MDISAQKSSASGNDMKPSVQKLYTISTFVGSTKPKGCHDPAYFCCAFIQSKIQVFKITFDTNCVF